jgi:hypothetical protein
MTVQSQQMQKRSAVKMTIKSLWIARQYARLLSLFAGLIVLAVALFMAVPQAWSQTPERATGLVVLDGEGAPSTQVGSCTLNIVSVQGNQALNNGESFEYSVSFAQPIEAVIAATLTFDWPSTLAGFTQRTIRREKFPLTGLIFGFFETEVAPNALAISGTYTVRVVVTIDNGSSKQVYCTASTQGTVGL